MVAGTLAEDQTMKGRAVTWIWILAGWTGLALFLGISSSLAYMAVGNPPRWSLTIRMALAEIYVWALLAPGVMALARRYPFTRATLGRSLAVHIPASLVISLAKLIVDQALRRWLFGFDGYVLITSLAPNFLFYWGIVAAAHGIAYYRSSRERELRASLLEARLATARLQLLQMQLHPHFLFNTLNAISELVHEDPETADRMITGLSELLREALVAGDRQQVPLRRELELVRRYLDIQQARFGDRLQVDIEVDETIMDALVPHFAPSAARRERHSTRDRHPQRRRARAHPRAGGPRRASDRRGGRWSGTEGGGGVGGHRVREHTQAAGSPLRAGRKCTRFGMTHEAARS